MTCVGKIFNASHERAYCSLSERNSEHPGVAERFAAQKVQSGAMENDQARQALKSSWQCDFIKYNM